MTATALYTSGVKNAAPPLTGNERVFADNGSAQGEMITTGQIIGLGTLAAQVANTSALAAAGLLTAAQVTGGTDTVYLTMTGAFGGAANIQLPTYASVAALTVGSTTNPLNVGSSYVLRIINPSGQTLTLTTNAGWTLNGTYGAAAIATESFRDFLVTLVGATAGTIQDVGGGAVAAE